LSGSEIEKAIARRSPGVYVLGDVSEDGRFRIRSIGRADHDLKDALRFRLTRLLAAGSQVGPETDLGPNGAWFKFSYAATADEAFANECLEFHAALESGQPLLDPKHPRASSSASSRLRNDGSPATRAFCPIWQCAWNY
jgi:hypothetical protein